MFGLQTLIPEAAFLDQSHHYVSRELTQGVFSEEARAFFLDQAHRLHERGADGVMLGCTELPMLIKQAEIDLPLLATTQLHIQRAVEFILSQSA